MKVKKPKNVRTSNICRNKTNKDTAKFLSDSDPVNIFLTRNISIIAELKNTYFLIVSPGHTVGRADFGSSDIILVKKHSGKFEGEQGFM